MSEGKKHEKKRISVTESAAIRHAQVKYLEDQGWLNEPINRANIEYGLPTPSFTQILELEVQNVVVDRCKPTCELDNCTYNCRAGTSTVLVGLRNGTKYIVRQRGFQNDIRLGVSITTLQDVTKYQKH